MAVINVEDAYILNEAGEQVDKATGIPFKDENLTEAEAAQARANIRAGGTNPNLLDNPWFTNPVNQRGQTTYSGGGTWIKTIDRWYLVNGANTLTVQNGYISVKSDANGFAQAIEPEMAAALDGETLTCSVLFNDGTLKSATGVYSNTATKNLGNGFYFGLIGGKQILVSYLTGNGVTQDIKAMKVEKGNVSTLANDAPPHYAEELAKCKYYFERLKATGGYAVFGNGIAINATNAYIFVPITPKRVSTYTVSSSGSLQLYDTAGHAITGITKDSSGAQSLLALYITSTGLTAAANYLFRANSDANAYIDINADL